MGWQCYLVMMAKLIPMTDAGALCLIALGREFASQKKQSSKNLPDQNITLKQNTWKT